MLLLNDYFQKYAHFLSKIGQADSEQFYFMQPKVTLFDMNSLAKLDLNVSL